MASVYARAYGPNETERVAWSTRFGLLSIIRQSSTAAVWRARAVGAAALMPGTRCPMRKSGVGLGRRSGPRWRDRFTGPFLAASDRCGLPAWFVRATKVTT